MITNVLKYYGIYNSEVEYCQGMNFPAGFFYLIYKDERLAFKMFSSLIDHMETMGMYKQNVPLLRVYSYKLNRLLAIYLPNLHKHFCEQGINSTHISSGWFLTCFCYVLQYTKDKEIPPFIFAIFDRYLFVSSIKIIIGWSKNNVANSVVYSIVF